MIRIADPENIGGVIRDLRLLTMTSQRDLAAECDGVPNRGQISGWEAARGLPSVPNLIKVFRALGYDLALVPREDA